MREIYHKIMQLSRDYLEVHHYILNSSMKTKNYEESINKLTEIEREIRLQQTQLEKHKKSSDFEFFNEHLRNIGWMVSGLKTVINGLSTKANNTGKYGFFQYRKDLKNLDETHKIFEISGNYLNSKASEYR